MGVGQSRELLGKINDDRVFICTNRVELLELLAKMQQAFSRNKKDEGLIEKSLDNVQECTQTETEEKKIGEAGEIDQRDNGSVDQCFQKTIQQAKIMSLLDVDDGCTDDNDNEYISLEEIHVPNHYIGDDGLISGHPAILHLLALSTALRSLDISYNALTGRSIEALVGNRCMPPNLVSLNLAGNAIGSIGCNQLAGFLATNPRLRELSLFNNYLYDNDVEPLLRGLIKNTNLRLLNLDCNYLTDNFLRSLLELLQQNTTLAVVMFDGPYDKYTFERTRNVGHGEDEEVVSYEDVDISANARALLRRRLLRADLAGRVFLPSALVREVEAIIAPRRAKYIAEERANEKLLEELAKEKAVSTAAAAVGRSTKSAACSMSNFILSVSSLIDDNCDNNYSGDKGCDGKRSDGVDTEKDGVESNFVCDLSFTVQEGLQFGEIPHRSRRGTNFISERRNTNNGVGRQSFEFTSQMSATVMASRTNKSVTKLVEGDMDSFCSKGMLPKSSRKNDTSSNAQRSSILLSKKKVEVLGRELSNGFDRLVLVSCGAKNSAKTTWQNVSDPPCRLRPCWCDPRDAPTTYGGLLHYHCKHEPTGYEMGEIGVDGVLLRDGKRLSRRPTQSALRRTPLTTSSSGEKLQKMPYSGCKATNHRCESMGFYGNKKPDTSSVFFFASRHPMCANVGDNESVC